jgi:CheY-like chemotaxis protein
MDINMPKMDGITASKKIFKFCKENWIRKPNICALTAYENKSTIKECLDIGMIRVLHKPLNFSELSKIYEKYFKRLSSI